jgi:hypothetical protein
MMRRFICNCKIQQQTTERVKVYYEHILKLTNSLHVKVIDVFLTTIFRACLLPYLKLTIASMKRVSLMEAIVVCEESGRISFIMFY